MRVSRNQVLTRLVFLLKTPLGGKVKQFWWYKGDRGFHSWRQSREFHKKEEIGENSGPDVDTKVNTMFCRISMVSTVSLKVWLRRSNLTGTKSKSKGNRTKGNNPHPDPS